MPFSNDEIIIEEEKSKLKTITLILGVGLFIVSLFNTCFCTVDGCRISFEALLAGWLAMLAGDAGLSWLANPLIVIAWILMAKNKRAAWLFGLFATLASLSFLKLHTVIEDEAGNYNPIIKIAPGYWFWLSSCVVTFIGSATRELLRKPIDSNSAKKAE